LPPHDGGPQEPSTPDALPALVATHWSAVYRLLFYLTGNRHDTEDLTQETFLRAMERMTTFRPGSNRRAWLLRIASNAYFDVYRRRRRLKFKLLTREPETAEPPEKNLDLAEQSQLVRAAMEELSDTTRLVFHLRVTEELSFRDIGAMAGISEEAARWHMHQARSKLLKRLEEPS